MIVLLRFALVLVGSVAWLFFLAAVGYALFRLAGRARRRLSR
jgi:hypothetical protein